MKTKKLLFGLAGAMALAVLTAPAMAADFPEGPITWVVNWPAGGGQDTTSRLLAEPLGALLGVPVVVENYAGAGGLTGMRVLASAKPDGYTVGMLGASSVIQQYTAESPVKLDELTVLSFFGPDPGALTVGPGAGVDSIEAYVAKSKAAPGSIINGNDPPGGASYISASILESQLGVTIGKIPYAGYAPTVAALLGGEVASVTVPVPQVLEHHKSGAVKILGVMSSERHFMAPEIPTFAEQGFDVVAGDFRAVVGPAGIPEDRAKILSDALVAVLSSPEFIARANAAGYMIEPLGAAETVARITRFDAQVYPVLEGAGLVVNPK